MVKQLIALLHRSSKLEFQIAWKTFLVEEFFSQWH